jgi:hypothetical protein
MAMKQNLGTAGYTLASFKANVRSAAGALSQQESGIIDLQLTDLIHSSILMLRSMMGRMVDSFYMTKTLISIYDNKKVATLNATPTAAGLGYVSGDVLTITTGTGDATVAVATANESTGAVEALATTPTFAGTGGYATGVGQATSGGTGSGCTVNVAAVTSATAGYGTLLLSSYSIANPNGISLFDPTSSTGLKEIPIVPITQFNALRSLYTTSDMGSTSAFASIVVLPTNGSSPYYITLLFYTNASYSFPTTVGMYYPRNPIKVTTDIDSVDLPDFLVPIAQDMTVISIFRRLSKSAPTDIENRVTGFINSQINQLGISVSPQNEPIKQG